MHFPHHNLINIIKASPVPLCHLHLCLIKWTDKTLNNIHSPVRYFLMNHENHYKLHVTHFIHFVIIEITYVKKKYIYNLQVAMAIRGRLCIIDLLLQARFTNHFMLITSCKC